MHMRDCASIRAKSDDREVFFEWRDFDGDDCFRDFHIDIVNGAETEHFAFGDCVVWGLRRSVRFFRGQQDKAGFGFRFPDIRTYDLERIEDGFSLQISFEETNRTEQFRFIRPALIFDDEFLKEYEGDRF